MVECFVEIAYVYEREGLHQIGGQCILVYKGDLFVIPLVYHMCFNHWI